MKSVGAIILAAGASSRLGYPKQFLTYEGETLLRRAVRAAINGGCSPTVVVVGADFARVEQELADLRACAVRHPQWQDGIGTSVRTGLAHLLTLAPQSIAIVVMVCDQPFVNAELIASLIARHTSERRNVACAYAGTLGVPALFTRAFFPELAALPDNRGARQLLAKCPHDVARIDFANGAIDIDTDADYRAHLAGR